MGYGFVTVAGSQTQRISRTFTVVVHPLRLQFREVLERGRGEAHAEFQFIRFVESNVLGGRRFDLLGEVFGHDRG